MPWISGNALRVMKEELARHAGYIDSVHKRLGLLLSHLDLEIVEQPAQSAELVVRKRRNLLDPGYVLFGGTGGGGGGTGGFYGEGLVKPIRASQQQPKPAPKRSRK